MYNMHSLASTSWQVANKNVVVSSNSSSLCVRTCMCVCMCGYSVDLEHMVSIGDLFHFRGDRGYT